MCDRRRVRKCAPKLDFSDVLSGCQLHPQCREYLVRRELVPWHPPAHVARDAKIFARPTGWALDRGTLAIVRSHLKGTRAIAARAWILFDEVELVSG